MIRISLNISHKCIRNSQRTSSRRIDVIFSKVERDHHAIQRGSKLGSGFGAHAHGIRTLKWSSGQRSVGRESLCSDALHLAANRLIGREPCSAIMQVRRSALTRGGHQAGLRPDPCQSIHKRNLSLVSVFLYRLRRLDILTLPVCKSL